MIASRVVAGADCAEVFCYVDNESFDFLALIVFCTVVVLVLALVYSRWCSRRSVEGLAIQVPLVEIPDPTPETDATSSVPEHLPEPTAPCRSTPFIGPAPPPPPLPQHIRDAINTSLRGDPVILPPNIYISTGIVTGVRSYHVFSDCRHLNGPHFKSSVCRAPLCKTCVHRMNHLGPTGNE